MMEGYYFSADILFDGKKIGMIVDEGNGGCITTRFNDRAMSIAFEKDCKEWCRVHGAHMEHTEYESEFWTWWDEARPKNKDAATYFKDQKEEMKQWLGSVKPVHTGNLALVEGKV
jgi:hypothetical protein